MREGDHMTACSLKKCSTSPLLLNLRINSGAIWKTYLAPTCFSWEKQGEGKKRRSLISWVSLSLLHPGCLKPPGARLTLIHSQPVPLTVTAAANQPLSTWKPEGLPERGKGTGWRGSMRKEGDEARRRGEKQKEDRERVSDEAGHALQPK